jgi:hypothetical protein
MTGGFENNYSDEFIDLQIRDIKEIKELRSSKKFQSLKYLIEYLSDKRPWIRTSSVEAIYELADYLIGYKYTRERAGVMIMLSEALGATADVRSVALLKKIYNLSSDWKFRVAVEEDIRKLGKSLPDALKIIVPGSVREPILPDDIIEIDAGEFTPYVYIDKRNGIFLMNGNANDRDGTNKIIDSGADIVELFGKNFTEKTFVVLISFFLLTDEIGRSMVRLIDKLMLHKQSFIYFYYSDIDDDNMILGESLDLVRNIPVKLIKIKREDEFYFDFTNIRNR